MPLAKVVNVVAKQEMEINVICFFYFFFIFIFALLFFFGFLIFVFIELNNIITNLNSSQFETTDLSFSSNANPINLTRDKRRQSTSVVRNKTSIVDKTNGKCVKCVFNFLFCHF